MTDVAQTESAAIPTWQERIEGLIEGAENFEFYKTNMTSVGWKAMTAEIADLRAALAAVPGKGEPGDHDEAVTLLGAIFDAWENGDDCHEDGDPEGVYMGKCFQLDDDVFERCCDLLNRLNPPRNAAHTTVDRNAVLEEVAALFKQPYVQHDGCDIQEAIRALKDAAPASVPKLRVWYGAMPESNGKSNFTAILHAGAIEEGITLDRSEYPDRVRYEADRARYLIGELKDEPFILDYDADKHSDYVVPVAQPAAQGAVCGPINEALAKYVRELEQALSGAPAQQSQPDLAKLERFGWTEAYIGDTSELVADAKGTYVRFADIEALFAPQQATPKASEFNDLGAKSGRQQATSDTLTGETE
jgi:hypothetical protein